MDTRCKKCGVPLSEDARFCRNCGTPAPPPHDGVFTSEHGSMTFPGDWEAVDFIK